MLGDSLLILVCREGLLSEVQHQLCFRCRLTPVFAVKGFGANDGTYGIVYAGGSNFSTAVKLGPAPEWRESFRFALTAEEMLGNLTLVVGEEVFLYCIREMFQPKILNQWWVHMCFCIAVKKIFAPDQCESSRFVLSEDIRGNVAVEELTCAQFLCIISVSDGQLHLY